MEDSIAALPSSVGNSDKSQLLADSKVSSTELEDEVEVENDVDGADATDTDCNIHRTIIRPTEM